MSTMRTDLLQNRLGTSHPAITKAALIHARININMETGVIMDVFNHSSAVDAGIGRWDQNIIAPFSSVYLYSMSANALVRSTYVNVITDAFASTASKYSMRHIENGTNATDPISFAVLVSGVLA